MDTYAEMLLQICSSYNCLPDPRDITATEIRFFYSGTVEELKQITRGKK